MPQLMRLLLVPILAAAFIGAPGVAEGKAAATRPSPVRDLDEPLPASIDTADPAAVRDKACAVYAAAKGDAARVREAYEIMRAAARLGDPDANLYLAKFLRAGTPGQPDVSAAVARIQDRLARDVEGARNNRDRYARIQLVFEKLSTGVCGPATTITHGEVIGLAPPPGFVAVPRARSIMNAPGGFAAVAPSAEADAHVVAAARLGLASRARDHACKVYSSTKGDPAHLQEAYIFMRTAADCGDELAGMYASAYLRMGRGAEKNESLANEFLRRTIKFIARHDANLRSDAANSLESGQCAPPDSYGARKINEMLLDFTN
jgi:TPR repeat protein